MFLMFFSRHSNRHRLGHLVFDAKKKETIFMENIVISIFGRNFFALRSQRFSAIVLGIGCARFMAFIHRIAYGSFV